MSIYTWKKFRKQLGKTQRQMATLFGVHYQTVFRWEHKKCFPERNKQVLARLVQNKDQWNLEISQIVDLMGISQEQLVYMAGQITVPKQTPPLSEATCCFVLQYKSGKVLRLLDGFGFNKMNLLKKIADEFDQLDGLSILMFDEIKDEQ